MEEYKSNSQKSKELPNKQVVDKHIEPIISNAKTKKRHVFSGFFSEDASNVKSYLGTEVLLPTIKKTISDLVTTGIDVLLYGEKKNHSGGNKPSYRSYYDEQRNVTSYIPSTSRGYTFKDVVLESRSDAEQLLDSMIDIVKRYGSISVADMYDLVGEPSKYTDNNYGWVDLSGAHAERDVFGSYILKLPKVMPL